MEIDLINEMYDGLGISKYAVECVLKAEEQIEDRFLELEKVASYNQLKVIKAMNDNRLSDIHFNWQSGYGYNDMGRETTESIFASVFGTEDAIVRPLIVNGTHALTLCLTGILRPNDIMLSVTGRPYDTLENVIGTSGENGSSLIELGILYNEIELLENADFDYEKIAEFLRGNKVKMLYIQRSSGYSFRKAIGIESVEKLVKLAKSIQPDIVIMVDNCYGEFLDYKDPTHVGVDIMAGSLIKNAGGGLALSGGYIVGKTDLIELVAAKMTSPGIGKECGLTFGQTRSIIQGLFLAPSVSISALKSAILCAKVYENLGYEICPSVEDKRSDIIQSIKLGTEEKIISFCKGIQAASPVDSHVTPMPAYMPGYESDVIMAAGNFIQGSSIELTADAPIREPYIVFYQGGLTYEHGKYGVMSTVSQLERDGLI